MQPMSSALERKTPMGTNVLVRPVRLSHPRINNVIFVALFGTQIWPALVTTKKFKIYEKLHSDNLRMIRSLVILCLQNDLMLHLLIWSCCCCCHLWWNPLAYHLAVYRICHSAVLPLYLPIGLISCQWHHSTTVQKYSHWLGVQKEAPRK